jgi:hypothetical protein
MVVEEAMKASSVAMSICKTLNNLEKSHFFRDMLSDGTCATFVSL